MLQINIKIPVAVQLIIRSIWKKIPYKISLKGQFQGQQTRSERGESCLARSSKFVHIFGKGAGARGGDGGERGQEKNQKICVKMLVDIKLYVYCNG